MKDNFSKQSNLYVKFRPTYPPELYQHILKFVQKKNAAWDCGTGNGQVAGELSKYFTKVYGTDISQAQINNAVHAANIEYVLCPAEKTPFADHTFDLITIGQAIHWFDFEAFYKEVKRVAKPGAIIAVWGYGLLRISDKIDSLIDDFYNRKIIEYWDFERRYIEQSYKTIPFGFEELPSTQTHIETSWSFEEFIGYLNTWSSVQKYIQVNKINPVDELRKDLEKVWKENEIYKIKFPVFLRIGKV